MKTIQATSSAWCDVTDEYALLLIEDPRYQRLHALPYGQASEEAWRAFLAAKKYVNTTLPLLTEPFANLERFDHFDVDRHPSGFSVWSSKGMPAPGVIDEWVTLLLHDRVAQKVIDFFKHRPTKGTKQRRPGRR
jgi:hypothetical protein